MFERPRPQTRHVLQRLARAERTIGVAVKHDVLRKTEVRGQEYAAIGEELRGDFTSSGLSDMAAPHPDAWSPVCTAALDPLQTSST